MKTRISKSGAKRGNGNGKGRFDLLPVMALALLAQHFERGAPRFGARNWEKGMPLSWLLDSGSRHLAKDLAGFDDEDHLLAAAWNLVCAVETRERIKRGILPKILDDLPKTYKGHKPNF